MYSFLNVICLSRCFVCFRIVNGLLKSRREKNNLELSRILKIFAIEHWNGIL